MRTYLLFISKFLCFILFYCICFAFSSHLNKHKTHKSHDHHWYHSSKPTVKSDQLSTYDIWKDYEKKSSFVDKYEPNIQYERVPPYYLSYESGQKTRYEDSEHKLIEQQISTNNEQKSDLYISFGSNEQNIANNYNKESEVEPKIIIESQVKETDNKTENVRKVGPLGDKGIFGYFVRNQFYKCDKPKRLDPDPDLKGSYIIPNYINYYHKCVYFEEDPTRTFLRKVGRLGIDGFYGYFENQVFVECEPPIKLDSDPKNPDLFYIPNDINYNPKCLYYEQNVSKRFDYLSDFRSSSPLLHNSLSIFIIYILVLIIS